MSKTNTSPKERVYPDDESLAPQTIAHHKARYRFAIDVQSPQGQAVDLACGAGYGTEILRWAGYQVTGVDISEGAITYARTHYPQCKFVRADLTQMSLPNSCKLITMFESLEHISFKQGQVLLGKIKQSLELGGILIISVPRDVNDKYNHFHISEWPYFLLKNELGSLFASVEIYGQDWDTGIISDDKVRENDFYVAVCRND